MRLNRLALVVGILFLLSCNNHPNTTPATDAVTVKGHPDWIMQGNIYEVNTRQYTPEGTFKAFEKHLNRLKQMGVQTLWFMPINPISKTDRKGKLGSPYAISNYTAINPEFGTLADWKHLVQTAHTKGFKVIIDWVASHTGTDHYWLKQHPNFYVHDSLGKMVSMFDWLDTRRLDYSNAELNDSMIHCMQFWVNETGIDGFRCDYAVGPTPTFWKRCISTLKKNKNLFMLAEGDSAWLQQAGFDATYAWPAFNMMKLIVKGERKAMDLDSVFPQPDTAFPANALKLYFTSNHDENSWNKADYETMPGSSHAPFAVLTQTIQGNVPLIYSGQEEPVLRPLRFFDKDTIVFHKYARAGFYKKLLLLRKYHPALASDASFTKIKTDNDKNVYAYLRKSGQQYVLVILNLSPQTQQMHITNTEALNGQGINTTCITDVMNGQSLKGLSAHTSFQLLPWDYAVYTNCNDSIINKLK